MSLPLINKKKKKKKKSKNKDEEIDESSKTTLPSENMFSLMERRGVYKTEETSSNVKKKRKSSTNGVSRSKNLKSIKKAQKKQNKSATKDRKKAMKNDWDEEATKRAKLKKAALMVDQLDKNCDENGKKKNKAKRRRQRQLQLQALKPGNGPSNMPLPEKEPEPEPEPEPTDLEKKVEDEEVISSDEEVEYEYEKDGKKILHKRMKKMANNGVPLEMQKKKWTLDIKFENPWHKFKRGCGEKMMVCGSSFRNKFQKSKRINMEAILAPESHKFSKQLEAQLRKKEDTTLLARSEETKPDRETDGVLEKEKKELTRGLTEAQIAAILAEEEIELTTRTALEVICKHISGVDCLHQNTPEKIYNFFQFDLRTRNTMELHDELRPLLTCSVGTLIDFAKNYSSTGTLNCISLGMFVDDEKARFVARKHAAENWTCFFCYSLEKIEDESCTNCGQSRKATDAAKRQEDIHNKEKQAEKDAKNKDGDKDEEKKEEVKEDESENEKTKEKKKKKKKKKKNKK